VENTCTWILTTCRPWVVRKEWQGKIPGARSREKFHCERSEYWQRQRNQPYHAFCIILCHSLLCQSIYWLVLTYLHSGWRQIALPNKTLDKFNSFQSLLAESQQLHGLWNTISMLWFAPVSMLSTVFSEGEIVDTLSTLLAWANHAYLCIMRTTHNLNSLALSVVPPFLQFLPLGFHVAIYSLAFSFALHTRD